MKKLLPLLFLVFFFSSCEEGLEPGQEIPILPADDDDTDDTDDTITVVANA